MVQPSKMSTKIFLLWYCQNFSRQLFFWLAYLHIQITIHTGIFQCLYVAYHELWRNVSCKICCRRVVMEIASCENYYFEKTINSVYFFFTVWWFSLSLPFLFVYKDIAWKCQVCWLLVSQYCEHGSLSKLIIWTYYFVVLSFVLMLKESWGRKWRYQ